MTVGFGALVAFPPTVTSITNNGAVLLSIGSGDSATNHASQIAVCLLNDSTLRVVRTTSVNANGAAASPVELAASAPLSLVGVYRFLELGVFVHDTLGRVELKIDGAVVVSATGLDTRSLSVDYVDALLIRGISAGSVSFDDLYVRGDEDTSFSSFGFLGDIAVPAFYANGDGTYTQFTPSTGTSHFALVDETSPNTTDYVSSSTALQKDSYTFPDVPAGADIKAVQVSAFAYKQDAGFRGMDLLVKSGATEVYSPYIPMSTTSQYLSAMYTQDPDTSLAWTVSGLNAAEFGFRVSTDI